MRARPLIRFGTRWHGDATEDARIARRRWRATAAALALAAVGAAGCGSSTPQEADRAATPTGTPSREVALDELPAVPGPSASSQPPAATGDTLGDRFLVAVFDDVQAMWARQFAEAGLRYEPARITLFRDAVDTACGAQSASIGPFYCPADQGVYLDRRFFAALSRSVGVRLGDFAQAYVIGHEVGHHVQFRLGIMQRVAAADQDDPTGANARSVRLELQADCFAGIWKHATYRRGQIGAAEIADALRAAAVVGDDFQQQRAGGTVRPESWTHGSSEQRQRWLTVGFTEGDPPACDTFGAR